MSSKCSSADSHHPSALFKDIRTFTSSIRSLTDILHAILHIPFQNVNGFLIIYKVGCHCFSSLYLKTFLKVLHLIDRCF